MGKMLHFLGKYLLLHIFMILVASKGIVELQLKKLINNENRVYDGSYCDGTSNSHCDMFLKFCLFRVDVGQKSMANCWPGDSREMNRDDNLEDQTIDFTNIKDLGNGLKNPIQWTFDSWTDEMIIYIEVWDADAFSRNDFVDNYWFKIEDSPRTFASKWKQQLITLTGKRRRSPSSLSVSIVAYCPEHYYTKNCDVFCKSSTSILTGHYHCNNETGIKTCLSNWYGDNCTRHCISRDDKTGHFFCNSNGEKVCKEDWFGESCTVYCKVENNSKQHFYCTKAGNKLCKPNWFGTDCSVYCDLQGLSDKSFCEVNGTRICQKHWYGKNCSIFCHPVKNATQQYDCGTDGRKICYRHWFGDHCSKFCQPVYSLDEPVVCNNHQISACVYMAQHSLVSSCGNKEHIAPCKHELHTISCIKSPTVILSYFPTVSTSKYFENENTLIPTVESLQRTETTIWLSSPRVLHTMGRNDSTHVNRRSKILSVAAKMSSRYAKTSKPRMSGISFINSSKSARSSFFLYPTITIPTLQNTRMYSTEIPLIPTAKLSAVLISSTPTEWNQHNTTNNQHANSAEEKASIHQATNRKGYLSLTSSYTERSKRIPFQSFIFISRSTRSTNNIRSTTVLKMWTETTSKTLIVEVKRLPSTKIQKGMDHEFETWLIETNTGLVTLIGSLTFLVMLSVIFTCYHWRRRLKDEIGYGTKVHPKETKMPLPYSTHANTNGGTRSSNHISLVDMTKLKRAKVGCEDCTSNVLIENDGTVLQDLDGSGIQS